MPFDPALPANNSPVSSAELRDQFNGLRDDCVLNDNLETSIRATIAYSETALNLTPPFTRLELTVSDPPTQAEVQAIADKLDALIDALRRP